MDTRNSFSGFIERIRAGDQEAAADLVRRFEPIIRREVRLKLRDPRLYRVVDSADICQSVLSNFFVRAALGEFDLDDPANLVKLLVGMVYRKVAFQVRKQRAQRRDNRRLVEMTPEELTRLGDGFSASRVVAGQDLLREFRARLSDEERTLADLRAQGTSWLEIAERLGGTPKTRCKQLARAVRRVAQQLQLDVGDA